MEVIDLAILGLILSISLLSLLLSLTEKRARIYVNIIDGNIITANTIDSYIKRNSAEYGTAIKAIRVYKKTILNGKLSITQLIIPEKTKIHIGLCYRNRSNKAYIEKIYDLYEENEIEESRSIVYGKKYKLFDLVTSKFYEGEVNATNKEGIHWFFSKKEAEKYLVGI